MSYLHCSAFYYLFWKGYRSVLFLCFLLAIKLLDQKIGRRSDEGTSQGTAVGIPTSLGTSLGFLGKSQEALLATLQVT